MGLSPDLVVPASDGDGFVISEPAPPPEPEPVVATAKPVSTSAAAKLAALSTLLGGWKTVEEVQSAFGWRAHTVRGRISDLGRSGTTIERKRVDGVTSYRIAPHAEPRVAAA